MVPENYKPKRIHTVVSILLLSLLTVYGVQKCTERGEATKSTRFTVGETVDRYFVVKSGYSINYRYKVNGIEYVGNAGHAYDSKVPNGRYWVEYSIEKPEISEIYQDEPVDPEIKQIPKNGFFSKISGEEYLRNEY